MTEDNIPHQQVIIVEHRREWAQQYQSQVQQLQTLLGDCLIQAHHIGSTSVENLAAKPVVDILLEVTSASAVDSHQTTLIERGYQYWGEYGISGRRYFTLGTLPRLFNIHSFQTGSIEVSRHLAFRDYLRSSPEIARQYETLKRQIANQCNHDIERYCQEKDAFIKHHQAIALKWFASLQQETAGE